MLKSFVHFILKRYSQKKHQSFLADRSQVANTQAKNLHRILRTLSHAEHYRSRLKNGSVSYEEFTRLFPITTYADYAALIDEQRQSQRAIVSPSPQRYQPTSGSTSQRKWIPYTKEFLSEIDAASMVWLHDLYVNYPGIARGSHYWSLSWLPTELREEVSNDDLDYLDVVSKSLLSRVMATPKELQNAPSLESSLFATLCYLASCGDLSFIFVWSPTFFLSLLRELELKRDLIVLTLSSGRWSAYQSELSGIKPPHSQKQAELLRSLEFKQSWPLKLWPGLSLLSCWTSADSSQWMHEIHSLCPGLPVQGKGLFATEGVVTIPVSGSLHLSYQSHFYEFLLKDGAIKRAYELVVGDEVRVLLTSSSGLLRYDLGDELRVSGRVGECPSLEFIGRSHTLDLVGEKLSYKTLKEILDQFRGHFGVRAIGFLAGLNVNLKQPQYVLVVEDHSVIGGEEWLEKRLSEHHHYALARELGQLARAQVKFSADGLGFFDELIKLYGWNKGDVKWETVLKVPHIVDRQ